MLNSEYIHTKIGSPETCFSDDSSKLLELTNLFPYASIFSVLYLTSLSNSGDIRLESELEKLALRINARDVLYNLLHLKPTSIVEVQESKEVSELIIKEEKIVDNKMDEVIIDESNDKSFIENKSKSFDDELDKLITSSAIANSFVERELEPMLEKSFDQNSEDEEDNADVLNVKFEKAEKKSEETLEVLVSQKSNNEISSPKTFVSWLKVVQSTDDEIDVDQYESKNTEYYSFEKPKKEFFSPVKKAKESLDENKMPVSETLAKIFALQGNYSKAIYVYEQLSLIFPEKKSFFATQIKNLKKKINS